MPKPIAPTLPSSSKPTPRSSPADCASAAHTNRFQLSPGSSHTEVHFYRQATDRLIQAGFDVLQVEVNQRTPEQAAMFIRNRLMSFFTVSKD